MNKKYPVIVHFPYMLQAMVPEPVRHLAKFLNPGIDESLSGTYTPDNLFLDQKEAKSFLTQCSEFGEQFKKPSDMAWHGVKKTDDFYSDTSLALRWEISTYGQDNKMSQEDHDLLKAQQLMLLEYVYEQRVTELQDINSSLGQSWQEFDQALGIERDDELFKDLERGAVLTSSYHNFRKFIWAFTRLVQDDACFLISGDEIQAELEDMGVDWITASPEKYFSVFPEGMNLVSGTLKPWTRNAFPDHYKEFVCFLSVSQASK